jgi:YfiH family protein
VGITRLDRASGGVAAHFAFADRHGGLSVEPYATLNLGGHVGDDPATVLDNRRLAADMLGVDAARVVYMNQVHGADVAVVDGPWPGVAADVDALVTTTPGLCLAVLVADCTPVLLADPAARVVAAAHAGRPGLAAGVVPATLRRMIELGADPARVIAVTGPAVCGLCYEVPAELQDEVAALVPASRSTTRQGTPGIDVPGGVWSQLTDAGVDPSNGQRSPVCAMESTDHFSYRREKLTGRFAGFVWFDDAG